MHILLTNDDGYFAPGLQTLYQALKAGTNHEISIVAPDSQRSATGHAITLFQPLLLTEHELSAGGKGYAVSGMPSDCVKLAIQGELVAKPDLVISGLNFGPNLGTDVFYSGTVAAAMEGVLLGVPALAVSLASLTYQDFEPAAAFLTEKLELLIRHNKTGLLNLNFPGKPAAEWRGLKITRLGKAVYENVFERRVNTKGRVYYWQAGDRAVELERDTDLYAIQEDYVSLTPMHSELTDIAALKVWREIFSEAEKQISEAEKQVSAGDKRV